MRKRLLILAKPVCTQSTHLFTRTVELSNGRLFAVYEWNVFIELTFSGPASTTLLHVAAT